MLQPINFHCVRVLIQLDSILCTVRRFFHERILAAQHTAALPEMHWFKWTYMYERAVKVMALLSLPAAGTSVTPRLAAVVLCRAAGGDRRRGGTATANGSSAVEKETNRPHPWTIPAPNCSLVLRSGSADRACR